MPHELSLRPHDVRTTGDGTRIGVTVSPYVRLAKGQDPPVFVQGGKFFCEGGPELKKGELPPWLEEELAKLSEATRRDVGLVK